jgi:hypothetical protein
MNTPRSSAPRHSTRPQQAYTYRKVNVNPRTGEELQHWTAVTKLPLPELLASYFVRVEVVNADGPRKQRILVRAPAGLGFTKEIEERAKATAKQLGLVPTGWASHE